MRKQKHKENLIFEREVIYINNSLNFVCLFDIKFQYKNFKLEKNKAFAEDLSDGKFSLPVIYSVTKFPDILGNF